MAICPFTGERWAKRSSRQLNGASFSAALVPKPRPLERVEDPEFQIVKQFRIEIIRHKAGMRLRIGAPMKIQARQ